MFSEYKILFDLFELNNEHLFIVGGALRNYYLNKDIKDIDFAVTCIPSKVKTILKDYEVSIYKEELGLSLLNFNNKTYEITTLRIESGIKDFRYPKDITFVNDINKDYLRRDFTVNAIYYNPYLGILDPSNGLDDIKHKKLKFILDPSTSIHTDPLRLLRALRFSLEYDLLIDDDTLNIICDNSESINNLNNVKYDELFKILNTFKYNQYLTILSKFFKNIDFKDNVLNILKGNDLFIYLICKYNLNYLFDNHYLNNLLKNLKKLSSNIDDKLYKSLDNNTLDKILNILKYLDVFKYNYYLK